MLRANMDLPIDCSNKDTDPKQLHRSLMFLFKRLIDDEEFIECNSITKNDKSDMTFDRIEKKLRNMEYKSSSDFFTDILKMRLCVLKSDSSASTVKSLKNLVDYCEDEIRLIDACDYCYALANAESGKNWFSSVCENEHRLVWAKVVGYPYEPAKLMTSNGRTATVHFFGEHKIALIPMRHCIDYSRKNPDSNYVIDPRWIQEVEDYKKNLASSKHSEMKKQPVKEGRSATATVTSAGVSTPSIRETVIELLEKNEAEFAALRNLFLLKEQDYRKEIANLRKDVDSLKKKHEQELSECKRKKWCDCCGVKTEAKINVFCSSSCGTKWYKDHQNVNSGPHMTSVHMPLE